MRDAATTCAHLDGRPERFPPRAVPRLPLLAHDPRRRQRGRVRVPPTRRHRRRQQREDDQPEEMAPDVRRLVVPHEHASNRASEPAGDAVAVLDVRVVHRPRRRLRARAQAAHPAARVERRRGGRRAVGALRGALRAARRAIFGKHERAHRRRRRRAGVFRAASVAAHRALCGRPRTDRGRARATRHCAAATTGTKVAARNIRCGACVAHVARPYCMTF